MLITIPQREMFLPVFIMSSVYDLRYKDKFLRSASFLLTRENK